MQNQGRFNPAHYSTGLSGAPSIKTRGNSPPSRVAKERFLLDIPIDLNVSALLQNAPSKEIFRMFSYFPVEVLTFAIRI